MKQDIRQTPPYRQAESFYAITRLPGGGRVSDATEIHVSPDGSRAVFTATILETLEGTPPTRIGEIDLSSGETRALTLGPGCDHSPKYSPDGRTVAFLSDRHETGDSQLYLLDPVNGHATATPFMEGWVEYLHWSPDGASILLGVAGHGADLSGAQGAITTSTRNRTDASWMPAVHSGRDENCWRWASVYDIATCRVSRVSAAKTNIWEATWCGNAAVAAVASSGPGEGSWYGARLSLLDLQTGDCRDIYTPEVQLGSPAASPDGKHLAIVEALCSDRGLVAGNLRLVETSTRDVRRVDTYGVDVTYTEWRSDRVLLLAGHRGLETVVGLFSLESGAFNETWSSADISTAGVFATVSGLGGAGDCVLVGEGFVRAPEIAVIEAGRYRVIKKVELGHSDLLGAVEKVERISWRAADGLEIHGWLLIPKGTGPYRTIMNIHGGPIWHWRPFWLGRAAVSMLMLAERGCAFFLPNPRGSSGRGQAFARRVVGDMGGADAYDCLAGLDYLVALGLADHDRLGVMGRSYGGFMTAWLISQDSRFAAAIPVAPVTNQVTAHLLSNIPDFVSRFLQDSYTAAGSQYFLRSPVLHVSKVKTPTLNICGALDRCTPPEEAIQFHNALMESAVESALVIYPEEGHGVRKFPAVIDYASRVVDWFEQHLLSRAKAVEQA